MKVMLNLILVFMLSSIAFAQLMPPHQFYGNVFIGGKPAKDGLKIIAKIGNLSFETYTKDGRYGYEPLFKIPSDNPATPEKDGGSNGDAITFYIEHVEVTSYTFESGGVTNLNLSTSSFCGDRVCDVNETHISCPADCPRTTTTVASTGGGGGGGKRVEIATTKCVEKFDIYVTEKIEHVKEGEVSIPILVNVTEDCGGIHLRFEPVSWKFDIKKSEYVLKKGVHDLRIKFNVSALYTPELISLYVYINNTLFKKYEIELLPEKEETTNLVENTTLPKTTTTKIESPTGLVVGNKSNSILAIAVILIAVILVLSIVKLIHAKKSEKK